MGVTIQMPPPLTLPLFPERQPETTSLSQVPWGYCSRRSITVPSIGRAYTQSIAVSGIVTTVIRLFSPVHHLSLSSHIPSREKTVFSSTVVLV